ncbi:heterokaryon incompatibility protein-domain-containing protein [Chaetomium strumarium]|uniref:Heterokaryon incompatibility protein-domain-containing protein n=1 Tax=Chaetomium strumarium TaxID=1170767 RepID=A0AAJ0GY64_9PEZI|nr:heterokaryon incompatibility protein-domain-containing protein [Chaetomium strumarium]
MNDAFCLPCQSLFEGAPDSEADWTEKFRRKPIRSHRAHGGAVALRDCAQTRCLLCAALWNGLPRMHQDRWLKEDKASSSAEQRKTIPFEVELSESTGCDGPFVDIKIYGDDAVSGCRFHFAALDGSETEALMVSPLRSQDECESTSSDESMQWAKQMLEKCEAHHEKCQTTPPTTTGPRLPTRLIFLGKPGEMPRLIETSEKLLVPCSPPLRYTTLSHCWGEVHPPKLTSENRRQFYNGIRGQELPKSFTDALNITRFLGIEYIWIDSLCIIQGDKEDWEHECTRMADVYRNSYCNIAALEATDSRGGCFQRRDLTLPRPIVVESRWHGQDKALWVYKPDLALRQLGWEIDDSPVHRRAWVLQERLLSRRILHFGRKMIYWECKELLASEAGTTFDPASLYHYLRNPLSCDIVNPARLSQDEIYNLVRAWSETVVRRYTGARLTFQTDKFIALSALARELHQILSFGTDREVKYLGGLWNLFLERQLLWIALYPETTTKLSHITDGVTAPSWSWASLNGPVEIFSGGRDDFELVAHVTGHTLTPNSGDPFFGPAAQSKSVLEITGLCWRLAASEGTEYPIVLNLNLDSAGDSSAARTASLLLPIAINLQQRYVVGLMLREVEHMESTTSYERVGGFVLAGFSADQSPAGRWQAWLDKAIDFLLGHKIIWPSQLGGQPNQDATVTRDIREKATTRQTIYLE